MEIRITHSPAQAATVQRINALLRENGFSAQVTPIIAAQNVRAAQPVRTTKKVEQPVLNSNFVITDFEPGY